MTTCRRRGAAGAAVLLGMLVTTACATGAGYHYAWGVTTDDLIGTWSVPGAAGTELVLAREGAFTVSSWPRNLSCAGTPADSTAELDLRFGEQAQGTWRVHPGKGSDEAGGSLPTLTLDFSEICTESPLAVLTREDDGSIAVCFPLDLDPDSFTSSRMLPFLRDEPEGDVHPC